MNQQEQTLTNKELERKVTTILRNLGIPCHLKGYIYLQNAILLCIEDFTLIYNITTELYPTLAKKYDTTYCSIERAIRNAIVIGWQKADSEFIQSLFGCRNSRPTNSELIAIIANELTQKQELEERIATMLRNLGIPCHFKGYMYLQSAILLCMEDYTLIYNITTELYPILAKEYNTTSLTVGTSILRTIKAGFKRGNSEMIYSIFEYSISSTTDTAMNSEFIARIVDELTPKKELEEKISTMLQNLGIPCHFKGYKYLQTAILLCMENRTLANHPTKELYPDIAKKYKTTSPSVEVAIHYAIEVAWQKNDSMKSMFKFRDSRPANLEFIVTIASKLNETI